MTRAIIVALAIILTTPMSTVQASDLDLSAKKRHRVVNVQQATSTCVDDRYCNAVQSKPETITVRQVSRGATDSRVIGGAPDGCPRTRYCGCATAKKLLGEPKRSLWPSAAWAAMPRVAPAAGTACWYPGHVKAIVGGGPGAWSVYNPNSGGHLTRMEVSDLRECRKIVSPHGAKLARLQAQ